MTEIYVLGATVILMACVVVAITRRNAVLSNEYMELLDKVMELIDRYEKTDKTYKDLQKVFASMEVDVQKVIGINKVLIDEIKGHKDDGR